MESSEAIERENEKHKKERGSLIHEIENSKREMNNEKEKIQKL